MNSRLLLPTLTATIGFSAAWLLKPATPTPVGTSEQSVAKKPFRTTAETRATRSDGKRPKNVEASDFPLADEAEQGPKSRDEAKMLRLTEALGLSIDQQGAIIRLIEEIQASTDGKIPVIEDLALRGNALEAGLAKLLSPEQLAKFQELRVRERENRIELRSQRVLTGVIEEIDLSPEQREEVLSRLRQRSKAELQSIPAAATLLFDKSMLPTGGKELSADGILLLAKAGAPLIADNPLDAHQKVLNGQRQELEEILRCFDGVLSPGQMGQYQAALAETRNILQKLPRGNPQPPPLPEPAPVIITRPEVGVDSPDETEEEMESEVETDSETPPLLLLPQSGN